MYRAESCRRAVASIHEHLDIPVLVVTDDDEGVCVRAMLIANNIVPMACQEKGRREGRDVRENRARLVEFMKGRKKTLIFVKPKKFVIRGSADA